jgi:hypothetical protein
MHAETDVLVIGSGGMYAAIEARGMSRTAR